MSAVKFPLSVVILAKNEAADIERCLRALTWCDEVIVVDDQSTDATVELAEGLGARVVSHRFESFARQRNWALEQAGIRNDWVLMLDVDEVMTDGLRQEIEERLTPTIGMGVVGFKMCRKTMLHGKWLRYSDGFPVWIVRLVRRGRFQFEDSGHGEVPVPRVDGDLATLTEPFLHYPFDKGLGHWIERHNRYSTREAERELQEAGGFGWSAVWSLDRAERRLALRAVSRRLPCRAVCRFVYQFIVKGGFLDGRAGLTFSWLMSVYEGFIVLKRRELELAHRPGRS